MLWMPIAAAVPMKVAISAESKAMRSVEYRALMMASFLNSSWYQCRVAPPHFARVREALKESTIKVRIGAYRRIKIKAR